MKAVLLLREGPAYRRELFAKGLSAIGAQQMRDWDPSPDLVVVWNRYGRFDKYCTECEAQGATIIVVENGYFGKDSEYGTYFAAAVGAHAGAGTWPRATGAARWRALGAHPLPLQRPPVGRPLRGLVLGQRSIGQRGVASPDGWARTAADKLRKWGVMTSVREHPGDLAAQRRATPLRQVVQEHDFVATWNSGAALKAMLWGKPVLCDFSKWVAAAGALPLEKASLDTLPHMADERQKAFEDVAAAQWSANEVSSGEMYRALMEDL